MGASVRQRLTELARKQAEDFQLVLTRYVIERLLYRLSYSPYRFLPSPPAYRGREEKVRLRSSQ